MAERMTSLEIAERVGGQQHMQQDDSDEYAIVGKGERLNYRSNASLWRLYRSDKQLQSTATARASADRSEDPPNLECGDGSDVHSCDSDSDLMAHVQPLDEREFEDLKARLRSLETARRYRKRIKVRTPTRWTEITRPLFWGLRLTLSLVR